MELVGLAGTQLYLEKSCRPNDDRNGLLAMGVSVSPLRYAAMAKPIAPPTI